MNTKLLVIWILSIGTCHAEIEPNSVISSIFDLESVTDSPLNLTPTVEGPPTRTHSYKPCGRGKECVREYLCANGKVIRNGVNLIDIRSYIYADPNGTEYFEEDYTTTDDESIEVECPYLETCCFVGYKDETTTDLPSNKAARLSQFSWIVLIYIAQVYHCGGALITPRVVLTAGHKVQRKSTNRLGVRIYEWQFRFKTERFPDQYRQVEDVIVHKQFNLYDLRNDVALLFLESPFDVALNEGALFLPPVGFNFDHSRCHLTGRISRKGYLSTMRKDELTVIPSSQCEANYRSSCLGCPWLFKLDSSHLCGIEEHRNVAGRPDIGSPLICSMRNDSNRLFLVGILVDNIKCRLEHIPGLYASVVQLHRWIDEQLARKGIIPYTTVDHLTDSPIP